MRTFSFAVASILALSTQASDCTSPGPCQDRINGALATYAESVSYDFLEADTMDGYRVGMIRFTGDSMGMPVPDQGSKGPILLLHSATQDCLTWFFATADPSIDSLPLQLFKDGYDVFLGCRRGTSFSRTTPDDSEISGAVEEKAYFDFDIQDVGENDTPAFISKILATLSDCRKVQILAFGLAISEALAGMAKYPNDSLARISNVVTLSPCAVTTFFVREPIQPAFFNTPDDDDSRRLLSAANEEAPRELQDITFGGASEPKGRQLTRGPSNYYWNVTLKNYCEREPVVCERYCEFYPEYCEQFCSYEQFAQYCKEPVAAGRCKLLEILERNDIYSFYGADWASQVATICGELGEDTPLCGNLQDSIDSPFQEMSVKELDHMWQHSYRRKYNVYQEDFCDRGGEQQPGVLFAGVDSINVPHETWYLEGDNFCDPKVNQEIMNTIPGQDTYSIFYRSDVGRFIYGQNDTPYVFEKIFQDLKDTPENLPDCAATSEWTD